MSTPTGVEPPPVEPMSPEREQRFAWSDEDLPYLVLHKAELIETARGPVPAPTLPEGVA